MRDPPQNESSSAPNAEPTLLEHHAATAGALPPADEHRIARGATLGRYVVLERVGAGGMGEVYSAYDPQLDRRIALKLLHARGDSDSGSEGRGRILREAQALARLSHPNVVAVHDVGVVDDRLFVAMEFVDGITLGRYIDAGPRAWSEVLPLFVAAGQGLAAAHAAGLVHRDFKPDNVMITPQGVPGEYRVRVMDFGLARAAADSGDDVREVAPAAGGELDRLTRTGVLLGTPAYMAPELIAGGDADARADQFAFCVACYRALYGRRPFDGDTMAELFAEVAKGRIAAAPVGIRVPQWLAAVVRRGLARDPSQRFATMPELLSALERGQRRRGRVLLASLGVAAVAMVGIGWAATARGGCSDGRDRVEPVWSDARREAVRDAFARSGAPEAERSADRVTGIVDRRADAWRSTHLQACEASRNGEQSERLLDLRMGCLARDLTDLDATVTVFAEADREVVLAAAQVLAALPEIDECSDAERLIAGAEGAPDPAIAADVEALRPRLARARVLQHARHHALGLEVARPLVAEAESLGYRPLLADALLVLGLLVFDSGAIEESVTVLERACFEAEAGRNDEVAVRAWSMLSYVQGFTLADRAAGDAAAVRAEAAALRAGSRPELVANVLHNRGELRQRRGDAALALADHREALRLLVGVYGEEHLDVGNAYISIGNALFDLGRTEEALESYERGRAVLEQVVGARHPAVANAIMNIGNVLVATGRPEAGREQMLLALAIIEEAFGSSHPMVGHALFNIGWSSDALGDYQGALDSFERAKALELPQLGPDHPLVAEYDASIGIIENKLGRHERARAHLTSALAIFEKALGPDHNSVARAHNDLGNVARALGERERAVAEHRAALRIRRKALPADHPELGDTLENLATALVELGAYEEAAPLSEELLKICEARASTHPAEVVEALLLLAQARRGAGQSAAARPSIERAVALADALGPGEDADELRTRSRSALRELDAPRR